MEVKTIAVIGAGAVGRAIAYAAALGGYGTVLEEVSDTILANGMVWIGEALAEDVRCGKLDAAGRDAALARISTSQAVDEAIRDAELIIEAVADEMEMKLELFTIFDKFAKPNAIFASAATSLSIGDFSDIVVHRERCIGVRFFEAGAKRNQVEIVRAAETSDEIVAACVAVVKRMRKEVVIVGGAGISLDRDPQGLKPKI